MVLKSEHMLGPLKKWQCRRGADKPEKFRHKNPKTNFVSLGISRSHVRLILDSSAEATPWNSAAPQRPNPMGKLVRGRCVGIGIRSYGGAPFM